MIVEILIVFPLYLAIFVAFFRFRHIIKIMSDTEKFVSDLMSDDPNPTKRDFLMEKVKNGESISNSKTPWTVERLEKASDKVIEKLYEKYQNPPPVKIDPKEAFEIGEPVCPVLIEMYAEGLESLVANLPYFNSRYRVNVEKLKTNISGNQLFCENLAIKIGSKVIEKTGRKSTARMGVSLASMTWDAVERVQQEPAGTNSEIKDD